MGWTSYAATKYRNGKIDRKAECDAYFEEGLNKRYYRLEKSAMVGAVYYAAVTPLKRYGKDKKEEDIPEQEQKTFGVVFLTRTSGCEFYYKDMGESMIPYQQDCPIGILNLLSETEDERANEWRQKCRNRFENRKILNNLKLGTKIKVIREYDKKEFVLEKTKYRGKIKYIDWDKREYLTVNRILDLGFKIIG